MDQVHRSSAAVEDYAKAIYALEQRGGGAGHDQRARRAAGRHAPPRPRRWSSGSTSWGSSATCPTAASQLTDAGTQRRARGPAPPPAARALPGRDARRAVGSRPRRGRGARARPLRGARGADRRQARQPDARPARRPDPDARRPRSPRRTTDARCDDARRRRARAASSASPTPTPRCCATSPSAGSRPGDDVRGRRASSRSTGRCSRASASDGPRARRRARRGRCAWRCDA